MTNRQNNGRTRASRPTLDPDYRPSDPPTGDGFWPAPVSVCGRCSAMIPATDKARQLHRRFHEQVAGLEDGRAR
jgi:hypothetical protein